MIRCAGGENLSPLNVDSIIDKKISKTLDSLIVKNKIMPLSYGIKNLENKIAIDESRPTFKKLVAHGGASDIYIYAGAKEKGVEPGLRATKAWRPRDTEKVLDPLHRYHQIAALHLLCYRREQVAYALKTSSLSLEEVIGQLLRKKLLLSQVQQTVMANVAKFKKIHFIKNDYLLPGGKNARKATVAVPIKRAQASGFGLLGKWIHQQTTKGSCREKNLSVVFEALANDVYLALGCKGQKLKIVRSNYPDAERYPKLLLDATEVQGLHGEKFHTLESSVVKGRLPNHRVSVQNGPDKGSYEIAESELALLGVAARLLGDRDKVGPYSANLGFTIEGGKSILQNIDPGKALQPPPFFGQAQCPRRKDSKFFLVYLIKRIVFEIFFFFIGRSDWMGDKNFHEDFTFDKKKFSLITCFEGGYKNFSVLEDTRLSAKMAAMKSIVSNWSRVEKIFHEYKNAFSKEGNLNFAKEIEAAWQRLDTRKKYFEKVLEKRWNLSNQELDSL